MTELYEGEPLFCYSDAEWSAIGKELPDTADQEACRRFLETFITAHKFFLKFSAENPLPTLDEEIKKLERLAAAARDFAEFPPWPGAIEELNEIAAKADRIAGHEKERRAEGRRGKPPDFRRDMLLSHVVNLWEDAGGVVHPGNEGGGPLARFLIAVVAPCYVLSPGSARAFLRKRVAKKPP